jgi:hypothetical protein
LSRNNENLLDENEKLQDSNQKLKKLMDQRENYLTDDKSKEI